MLPLRPSEWSARLAAMMRTASASCPVELAAAETPVMLLDISWVEAACSSTALAMASVRLESSPTALVMVSMAPTASPVAFWIAET